MTVQRHIPEGQIADAAAGNWVDSHAPRVLRPYFRLSRLDRPIGTWLLLLPCWWGLSLAILSTGRIDLFDFWIAIGCAIGSLLMRGAGCTWNDITDRNIDGAVLRTANRPIPSGQVTIRQAFIWMVVQSLAALMILLTFNPNAILLGITALIPVAIYPFAKRFTWWPQVFLGLAFNWGALLAWTAHAGTLGWPAMVLYLSGISWTLFYDTIYAHQDAEDDALIGVKSTARLFGDNTTRYLAAFLLIATILMALAVLGAVENLSLLAGLAALAGPAALGVHLFSQLQKFDPKDSQSLLSIFRSNKNAGLLPLPFFAVAFFL